MPLAPTPSPQPSGAAPKPAGTNFNYGPPAGLQSQQTAPWYSPPQHGATTAASPVNNEALANFWLQWQGYNADKSSANNALAGIGLQRQGIGIDRAAAERQLGYLAGQHGIQMERYGIAGDRLGLEKRALGIRTRGVKLGERRSRYDARRNVEDLWGQLASAGSVTTRGARRGMQDIHRDLADQLAKFKLERRGIALDRADLRLKRGELRLAKRDERMDYAEDRARIHDRLAQLDLAAKELGLRSQDVKRALDLGLKQSFLDLYFNAEDLLTMDDDALAQLGGMGSLIQNIFTQGAQQLQGMGIGG